VIALLEALGRGGEASVVVVEAGVEGLKVESGLVTKPPAVSAVMMVIT
jgi:hypothetical protein